MLLKFFGVIFMKNVQFNALWIEKIQSENW